MDTQPGKLLNESLEDWKKFWVEGSTALEHMGPKSKSNWFSKEIAWIMDLHKIKTSEIKLPSELFPYF